MSIQAMVWVLEHSLAKLGDRLVAMSIANHADAIGRCWPSIPQIAREAGLHERQVYRSVKRLCEGGELRIVGNGFRGVNIYELTMNTNATPDNLSPDKQAGVTLATPDKSCTTPDKCDTDPCLNVTQTLREPSRSNLKKDSRSASASLSDREFEDFWRECPKKVGKGAAHKAWLKARQMGAALEALIAGMKRFAALKAGSEVQFIAHPATWLNQQRWLDEEPGEVVDRPIGPPPMIQDEHGNWINPVDGSIVSKCLALSEDAGEGLRQEWDRVSALH